jgi:flagellar motor switch protein FliM
MNPPLAPTQTSDDPPVRGDIPFQGHTFTGTENGPLSQDASIGTEVEARTLSSPRLRGPQRVEAIGAYEFRQTGFLAPAELHSLRSRHEHFVTALVDRLGSYLNADFAVRLARFEVVSYRKFVGNLADRAHITLFRIEPIEESGLLVIPLHLALSLVDRLLGGPGQSTSASRDLSEIEAALIDKVSSLVLAEWCRLWPEKREFRPCLLGHEIDTRLLRTATADTAMLALTLDGRFGDQHGTLQLAFPYATVEPLVRLLHPADLTGAAGAAPQPPNARRNQKSDDVSVPVMAEWQGLQLSARDLARMKTGDVLLLDPTAASQVQLCVNQTPRFVGRPGTCAGRWAVELSGPVLT